METDFVKAMEINTQATTVDGIMGTLVNEMGNTKGIKVHDTVWVDMSNWSGIPPHESGYAVVDDFWAIPEYDKAMYRLMYAVKFRGSDDVIIVNGRRITPINEDADTQENTQKDTKHDKHYHDTVINEDAVTRHDKHYRDAVVEPILVMQALFSRDEFIGFLKGNILKYRLRVGHKGGDREMQCDLDKIRVYEMWLDTIKNGERIVL